MRPFALPTLESLPSTPEAALEVGGRGYSVALDPTATAPYALVGVMFGSKDTSRVHLLAPGDVAGISSGFDRLYVFHALGWLTGRMDAAYGRTAGRCTLLVADDLREGLRRDVQSRGANGRASSVTCGPLDVNATAPATLLGELLVVPGGQSQGNLGFGQHWTPFVPLASARRVRAAIIPTVGGIVPHDVAGVATATDGAVVAPAPADFAVKLAAWKLHRVPLSVPAGGLVGDVTVGRSAVRPDSAPVWVDPFSADGLTGGVYWVRDASADLAFDETTGEVELDTVSGLCLAWQAVSIAGTGVDGATLAVEVF